jgi:hypothetical protein
MTQPNGQVHFAHFDNAIKMLSFSGQPHVGAVVYGTAAIGSPPRTIHGFLPEFEERLSEKYSSGERGTVVDIARELGKFYSEQWQQLGMPAPANGIDPMVFIVAGFDESEAYGRVYQVTVPTAIEPVEQNAGTDFGICWGGQGELVYRLMNGFDPRALAIAKDYLDLDDTQLKELETRWRTQLTLGIPSQFLPLQDCVDLSSFLVNMTAVVQTWTVGVQGVGGAVDVAIITRTDGLRAIRQKTVEIPE